MAYTALDVVTLTNDRDYHLDTFLSTQKCAINTAVLQPSLLLLVQTRPHVHQRKLSTEQSETNGRAASVLCTIAGHNALDDCKFNSTSWFLASVK